MCFIVPQKPGDYESKEENDYDGAPVIKLKSCVNDHTAF